MRYSRQRHLVKDVLQKSHQHLSADQIFRMVKDTDPNISIATVYRNLNQLVEIGEIVKLNVPDAAGYYDGNNHPHFHMQCEQCGGILDIPGGILPDIKQLVAKATKFEVSESLLFFKGTCEVCLNQVTTGSSSMHSAGEENV